MTGGGTAEQSGAVHPVRVDLLVGLHVSGSSQASAFGGVAYATQEPRLRSGRIRLLSDVPLLSELRRVPQGFLQKLREGLGVFP